MCTYIKVEVLLFSLNLPPYVTVIKPLRFFSSIESISANNGRPRSGLRRASPGPPLSQPQSQSSSEFGLSLARTDSGGRTNTDLSETSEDYVTANTSTETGTTTGTSATTSSWSRPPQTSSAAASAASAPASTTATAAEGSSFESASSIYSLARSEVSSIIFRTISGFVIPILRIYVSYVKCHGHHLRFSSISL